MRVLILIASFTLLLMPPGAYARQSESQPTAVPQSPPPETQTEKPQSETAPPADQSAAPAAPAPETPNVSSQNPAAKPARKPGHSKQVKKRRAKVVKPSSAADPPKKVIVRNGGARDTTPQISPAMSQEQQRRQREETAELLGTTDENLKKLEGRQLTSNQQGVLTQIRNYMQQSRAASDLGDLERANTLALKAHLLSDDLLRR